ncbi:Hypothetical protein UVM_LOCUS505 [uncultured virus]|nr:Hypothetical protein UVM_LOCUS505 [uncultured virus]
MSVPGLPTEAHIAKDVEGWRDYARAISAMADRIAKQREQQVLRDSAVSAVGSLFEKWVPKSAGKTFEQARVEIAGEGRYAYDHDGVRIRFLGRVTWHLGDLDYFVDRSVHVNGQCLLDQEKA